MRRYENRPPPHLLQCLYDDRVVWPPEVQEGAADCCDRCELAYCFLRILLSGSGEPHRLWGVHCVSTENHSGSDYPVRVRRVCVDLSGRAREMESHCLVSLHYRCGGVCLLGQTLAQKSFIRRRCSIDFGSILDKMIGSQTASKCVCLRLTRSRAF